MSRTEIIEKLIDEGWESRRKFAEHIGVPPTTLQSILKRGVGNASIDNVMKICKGLGITIDELETMNELHNNSIQEGKIAYKTSNTSKKFKDQRDCFSENLQYLLKENDISQKKLAEYLNVSETSVSNWSRGEKYPRIDKMREVANYFGIKLSELMEEKYSDIIDGQTLKLPLYGSVAAGALAEVEGITTNDVEFISVPRNFLGKYGECEGLFAMYVNGDSMNKVIKNGSIVIAKAMNQLEYKDGDIVIFSYNNEYSLKRFAPNELEGFVLFKTESFDSTFKDIAVSVETMNDLQIYGKVIFYGTTL